MASTGRTVYSAVRYLLPAAAALSRFASPPAAECSQHQRQKEASSSRLIFVGTGSSTGCPRPACALLNNESSSNTLTPELQQLRRDLTSFCRTSNLAAMGDPKHNKNYRNNPSLVISFVNDQTNTPTNVIIDVGKTFREGALRWLPDNGVATLDAVILTHAHMDAAAGLDDIRGFQHYTNLKTRLPNVPPKSEPMPIFLEQSCLEDLQERFPWLLPKEEKREEDKPLVERHVASFDVTVMKYFQPVNVKGLKVYPLPVMHGEDLVSLGFAFTVGKTSVVYLSDISRMLPETLDFIMNKLPPTDLLIVDALHPVKTNPVHYNLLEAVELARQIRPKQTLLVGSNCDSFLPHDETNQELREKYGNVQMAHDGLVIETS